MTIGNVMSKYSEYSSVGFAMLYPYVSTKEMFC